MTTGAAPAAAAATTATAAMTTTAAAAGKLHATADALPVEEVERGQTDVGHFLFAKNEAPLIGRIIVGLRHSGRRHRRCGGTAEQRKTESCGTQHAHSGGFALAFLRRSLTDP
jgi:hypothetical protein